MKHIIKFNESIDITDSWTLDKLFSKMNHPFLEESFVLDIFSDIIDQDYLLAGDWVYPDGYHILSNPNNIRRKIKNSKYSLTDFKLKGFSLHFTKNIGENSYRNILDVRNELDSLNGAVVQYLNQSEFDEEYIFEGMEMETSYKQNDEYLSIVSLSFKNTFKPE